MVLNSSGNVGIGTTSPAEKLDVVGGGLAAGNGTIKTGITYSSIGLMGTFTNHDLGILTNGSIKATITSGGNVLIGTTTSVNHRMVVASNSDANAICLVGRSSDNGSSLDFFGNNSSTFLMEMRVDSVSADLNYQLNAPMIFYTNTLPRMTITGGGNVLIGGADNGAKLSIAGGRTFINTGQTTASTAAYTSYNNLTFNDDFSDVARGPNKIITYGRGTTWVAGLGIHDDTQAYYAGGTHKWYKYNGTTATLNLSLDGSGNLTTTGTIKTAALDGGYVAGTWKLGRALLGTQPSETYQIIVEINGQLYAIGAANI